MSDTDDVPGPPGPTPRPEGRFRTLFVHSHDAVGVTDGRGILVDVNPAMVELLAYPRDELLGSPASRLFADAEAFTALRERQPADGGAEEDAELRVVRRDGLELTCRVTLARAPAEDEGGDEALDLLIVDDVTERVHVEERFQHAAHHDSLTQLPNRALFLDRTQRRLERWKFQPENHFAVLFVDLDRFKLVNDSLGHRAGDELLIRISERLEDLVRPEDIVARFGGDEFTILLFDLPREEAATRAAERIQRRLRETPINVLGHDVHVTASIGIAMGDPSYSSADEVIRDADTAMYAAKDAGRGKWAVFDDEMRDRAVLRFTTETALQLALKREEFVLHYQPLVTMDTGRILGFEALVRWRHPERGLLPPSDFLPLAEDTGQIVPLGRWVLREACRVASAWREERSEANGLFMAVNVSTRQLLDPGLVDDVRSALEAAGLPGPALRLEITEPAFLNHSATVRDTVAELIDLGIRLCLDDFGRGYSSLGYLKDLPLTLVKIDRSFVRGLSVATRGPEVKVAAAMVSLARQLGVGAVAEGVETEDERECLIQLGCPHGQGFLYSRPVEEAEARALLEEGTEEG